jgi:hypothetical protein
MLAAVAFCSAYLHSGTRVMADEDVAIRVGVDLAARDVPFGPLAADGHPAAPAKRWGA